MAGRGSGAALLIVICLFLGFWAFVYQGYTEDADSPPIQSWPVGAGCFAVAGTATFLLIRTRWRALSSLQLLGVVVLIAAVLLVAALGSMDAGGSSFEF